MQLVDRIEKRRFVGREFLLWLWFESELFDATLSTREHGPFGLWLEKRLVLSEGKEKTSITAPTPGLGREAKEALLRGQLPESAGVRIAWRDDETSFAFKAETLGVAGLKLQTVLGKGEDEPNVLLEEMMGNKGKKPRGKREPEDQHEVFYERMQMTAEFEELVQTLYRDFLALRLSASWDEVVTPLLRKWVLGVEFELATYEELRRPPTAMVSDVLELHSGARVPSLDVPASFGRAQVDDAAEARGPARERSDHTAEANAHSDVRDLTGAAAAPDADFDEADALHEPRVAAGE